MKKALIFVHGEMRGWKALEPLKREEYLVYCTDGGSEICAAHGVLPDVIIGDMDSIAPGALEEFRSKGVTIKRFPVNKDESDLELALNEARAAGVPEVILVAALGGRLDHLLANVLFCTNPAYRDLKFTLIDGETVARRLTNRQSLTIKGRPADVVSLIPLSPKVRGVSTSGLRWELSAADLQMGSTWTISNQLLGSEAVVSVSEGILLVVHTSWPEQER